MRKAALLTSIVLLSSALFLFRPSPNTRPIVPARVVPIPGNPASVLAPKLKAEAIAAQRYCRANNLSTRYCFLLDLSIPSGRNRFFVYDLEKDSVLLQGLVAHGSCNTSYVTAAAFSNTPNSGCSSTGKYKVGYKYKGRFGRAYKLFGLEETNSHAFDRAIVLHAYGCVPDKEVYPHPICNSLGCPMVSETFLAQLAPIIDTSGKPLLLWILP